MKKVLLWSIQPQHMLNILNGRKTIEIRKRTLPQWALDVIAQGGVVEGYGYCKKGGEILSNDIGFYTIYHMPPRYRRKTDLNAKVVVKFQVSGSTKYNPFWFENTGIKQLDYLVFPEDKEKMCLEDDNLREYGQGSDLYAHHLTNITPVNMELREFYKDYDTMDTDSNGNNIGWYEIGINPLTKAPQSFQSVWVKGE